MKRFLKQILLFLLPVFAVLCVMEYFLKSIPSTYQLKAKYLHEDIHRIQILCLGNSSGAYAFDPEAFSGFAFNAAQVSQSLDMDYAILEKNIGQMDSLRYIVLTMSYPTLFFNLEHSLEEWRLPYYNYYGIKTNEEISKKPLLIQNAMRDNIRRIKGYYVDEDDPARRMTRRGLIALDPSENVDALRVKSIEVADRHTVKKMNVPLVEENIGYVMKMIDIARQRNVKVVMVTFPFHEFYKSRLYDKQLAVIKETVNILADGNDVFYFDMNDLGVYDMEDFYDGNHLSYIGARKVSLQLDSIIKTLPR